MAFTPSISVARAPETTISWGNFVGIVAIGMFVVYLIAKGRLGVYLGILGIGSGGAASQPVAPGFGTGSTVGQGNVIQFPAVNFGPLTL